MNSVNRGKSDPDAIRNPGLRGFSPRAAALIPACGLEYGKTPTAEDYPRMCGIAACFSALSGFVADCPRHGGTPIARSALAAC